MEFRSHWVGQMLWYLVVSSPVAILALAIAVPLAYTKGLRSESIFPLTDKASDGALKAGLLANYVSGLNAALEPHATESVLSSIETQLATLVGCRTELSSLQAELAVIREELANTRKDIAYCFDKG